MGTSWGNLKGMMMGMMLKGNMKKMVNIKKAIISGNYTATINQNNAYRFIDVALVPVIEAGELHGEPEEEADDEREDVEDVGFEYPELVDDGREDDHEEEQVVEEVVVEEHLEGEARADRRLQDPQLRVRDVVSVIVDLVLLHHLILGSTRTRRVWDLRLPELVLLLVFLRGVFGHPGVPDLLDLAPGS